MLRVRWLIRLESLINVGCKFGPNDLDPDTWDELIAMALERQFVDRLVAVRREKNQHQESKLRETRQATGVPQPGGTLFEHSKPFR